MACEKHGYTNNVLCPACDLELIQAHNHDELLARLNRLGKTYYSYKEADGVLDDAAAAIRELTGQLAAEKQAREEAERLVYIPGQWRCAKCKLPLMASNINLNGSITADSSTQQCPNGCGPMWRVTERGERKEAQDLFLREFDRATSAEQRLAQIEGALRDCQRIPLMPFPDPSAHSWEAFGKRTYRAWQDIQAVVSRALRTAAPQETGGELTSEKSGKETNPTANPVTAAAPPCVNRTGCETPNDCKEHGYCRSPHNRSNL